MLGRHAAGAALSALLLAGGSFVACAPPVDETAASPATALTGADATDEGAATTDDGAACDAGRAGVSARDAEAADAGRVDADADAGAVADAGAEPDAAVVPEPPPEPPAVRFVGRFDTSSPAGPRVAWPGATIVARFAGTGVSATFADTKLFGDYGGSRWEVSIDGVSTTILQLDHSVAQQSFVLAAGLADDVHTVELYKLTEASVGTTQFLGFDFGAGTLLAPPPAATRHLQFLGDSASNGYGIEGASSSCSFSAATENERKAFPGLVAHDLLADHHSLGASGKGVYQSYTRSDADTYGVIYQRAGVTSFASPLWDATQYAPDVVWITLGGNDYSKSTSATDPPPFDQFQARYDQLVTTVRAQHPSAHVFCAVAPSLTDAYPAGFAAYTNVKTALQNVVAAHPEDTRLYVHDFARAKNGDLTGCGGHPGIAKHRAMADEVIAAIRSKTGW